MHRKSPGFDFDRRSSGILMHPTSLPGPHGGGDLGPWARRFVDFLSKAGQTWWQMLPVVVPDRRGCPYNSISSIAGSPHLISLEDLAGSGLLTADEIAPPAGMDEGRVDFPIVHQFREERLRRAYARFSANPDPDFRRFRARHQSWLEDFALFRVLKERAGGARWNAWDSDLRSREPGAIRSAIAQLDHEMDYHRFVQFIFYRQWRALRAYARERGVGLIGDMPIFVAHDSVDVWSNTELFELDRAGRSRRVTGVPPDAFSKTGQLWGHPQYRWPAHARTGFRWWVERLRAASELFDAMRIDHFLGFSRVWSIPATARSAKSGRWVASPGEALFTAVTSTLGEHPLIAEDLGLLTPQAARLRDQFNMPGMQVLQFGFASGGRGDPGNRPHGFARRSVAYTGTHDNQTILGWFGSLDEAAKRRVARYAGVNGEVRPDDMHRALIRAVMASAAETTIFPMQDVLGLGDEARMNTPGTPRGNWGWRMRGEALGDELATELRVMTETYDRLPAKPR
jgi:4-alpha-glucanotransferase